jgi:hypothetical protein
MTLRFEEKLYGGHYSEHQRISQLKGNIEPQFKNPEGIVSQIRGVLENWTF